ncbi:MAG TPA: class I SAM-dependent rRNA methyltransferase [Gemmatimonadales bacterium]|jgi:23S rRNA (cytosine1962-C5)-methyltransferase
MTPAITLTPKGAARLVAGHPWIYRSDLGRHEGLDAGLVRLLDPRGKGLGTALFSPHSEIRVRWLAPDGVTVDASWWQQAIHAAVHRRAGIIDTGARMVHAEGDGLPSLIVDRYGAVAVAQLLSAGLETVRGEVIDAIRAALEPRSLLLRNDASVRTRERLPRETVAAFGDVPERAPYSEGALTFNAAPWKGQKTGAYLDQRENHQLVGGLGRGRCLDVFSYHGAFALQMLKHGASDVVAIDSSKEALAASQESASENGLSGLTPVEADAFDWLRSETRAGKRYEVVVLDPPAFAKEKGSVERALAGYKELNLQAMKLLAPGGHLFTASCSYHVHRGDFFQMLSEAAADSGRRMQIVEIRSASSDHPELVTVPETGYLKAALLRAIE